MSKHINEWLSAYLDGELHGGRLHHVEAHLAECPACRAELESFRRLSALVKAVPAPEFTLPERLASQVSLRLPHRQAMEYKTSFLEIGWWMIPVTLLAAWIFIGTSFFTGDMLSAANTLGLVGSASDWLMLGPSREAYWAAALGQFGILSGQGLDLAAAIEAMARTSLPQISWQISIALLYLSWLAIWWARHTRKGYGHPQEG